RMSYHFVESSALNSTSASWRLLALLSLHAVQPASDEGLEDRPLFLGHAVAGSIEHRERRPGKAFEQRDEVDVADAAVLVPDQEEARAGERRGQRERVERELEALGDASEELAVGR